MAKQSIPTWFGIDDNVASNMRTKYGDEQFALMMNYAREAVVQNISTARRRWMDNAGSEIRNVRAECQYVQSPTADDYWRYYERHPIAARVVELFPRETWQTAPYLYETQNEEEETPFEIAWRTLCKNLGGMKSWHVGDDDFNPIWEVLQKADELSGIGHYGVIVLGFDDVRMGTGRTLADPAFPVEHASAWGDKQVMKDRDGRPIVVDRTAPYQPSYNAEWGNPVQTPEGVQTGRPTPNGPILPPGTTSAGQGQTTKLLWVRSFHELQAQVATWDSDPYSPRCGMPKTYNIHFNDPREGEAGGIGLTETLRTVHWTRVVHVVDNMLSHAAFGMPRMKQVLDRITDLDREYGAGAEALWQQAFGMISFETHPELGGDVAVDDSKLKDMMEMVRNGMQRWIRLSGMTAKQVSPGLADMRPQIEAAIEAICIKLGCPVRIFKGSERGELASTQDDDSWNDRVGARRLYHANPRIIIPVVDRLIMAGCLPPPGEGYGIGWTPLTSRSAAEKATTAMMRTQAISAYLAGDVESFMSKMDYLTKELGYTQREAEEIAQNAGWLQETQLDGGQPNPADDGGNTPLETPGEKIGGEIPVKPAPVQGGA